MNQDPSEESFLDELPELADDGSLGIESGLDEDLDLESAERESSALDDSLLEDAFDAGFEEDETTWIGDEDGGIDLGNDDPPIEFESGFIDDAKAEDLDVGFEVPADIAPVVGSDIGQEGLDEPLVPRTLGEDEVDLPPLDPVGNDEADDLDIGIASIVPS